MSAPLARVSAHLPRRLAGATQYYHPIEGDTERVLARRGSGVGPGTSQIYYRVSYHENVSMEPSPLARDEAIIQPQKCQTRHSIASK